MKSIIKRLFSFFGIQVTRVSKTNRESEGQFGFKGTNVLEWLRKYGIGVIIDVGANEGQFAEKILTIFPAADLHCFEPLEPVFDKLVINFKNRPNVKAYNYGLGEADQEKTMYSNEYSPSSSMLEMLDLHKNNFGFAVNTVPATIKIRRLDGFFEPLPASPILLKIDVQGYELFVLKGGEKIVEKAAIVVIETTFHPLYQGQPLFADIYNWLVERGFSYAGNMEQLLAPSDNAVLQADAIFIRNKK